MPTTTVISLPENFISNLSAQVNNQIIAFSPYLLFILGILAAVVVAEVLLSFFRK